MGPADFGQEKAFARDRVVDRLLGELDALDNTMRGMFAEELVAALLPGASTRPNWAAWDIDWGDIRIEVKTTGLFQSWHGPDHPPSRPSWSVGARRGWDPETNTSEDQPGRAADVYVLCLHEGHEIDDGWSFFVVATALLDELGQKTVSRSTLDRLVDGPTSSEDLADAVRRVAGRA